MIRLILRMRDSLYAIPVVIVLACAGLAFVALFIDAQFGDDLNDWPLVLGTTVAGARAIAMTVAGATITVAAIVFSIAALSTQMAALQYSPRALGEFFEDPFQQTLIGLVVGTFTYSLFVLASLSRQIIDGSEPSPSLSATLAITLGVASAVGIVVYINHSLRRMQIDLVVRRLADASVEAIDRHLETQPDKSTAEWPAPQGESRAIRSNSSGWVVVIDQETALRALPPRSVGRIDIRPGEAVSVGDRIMTVWPDPGEEWDGQGGVRRSIVTAHERSLGLDPTFGIRQLVDIALRALSIGVNDPTTAVDVIYHLKTPVRRVLLADAPHRVFAGPDDRRLYLADTPSRSDYVYAAFSEIRLSSARQPYVLASLIEVLGDLKTDLKEAGFEEREGAVDQELESTIELARTGGLPEPDLRRILERVSMMGYLDEESSG